MKVYTYRSKKTGRLIASKTPIKDDDLVLVTRVANGQMKSARIRQK